jgi:hypothetical protein
MLAVAKGFLHAQGGYAVRKTYERVSGGSLKSRVS